MTCIVGLISGQKAILGADSRVTSSGRVVHGECSKLIEKDGYVIGLSGSVRVLDLIQSEFNAPKRLDQQGDLDYLKSAFTKALREMLEAAKFTELKDGITYLTNAYFLILYKNKLYSIYGDYSVMEHKDFHAIGSGGDFALGALDATKNAPLTPEQRVTFAISAACTFDLHCAPPIKLIVKEVPQ